MNTISGVTFGKDRKTSRRYVRVDLEQYGDVITPFLEQIGALEHEDDFEKEYASAISGEELRQRMHKRIDAWAWKEQ